MDNLLEALGGLGVIFLTVVGLYARVRATRHPEEGLEHAPPDWTWDPKAKRWRPPERS